MQPPWLYCPQLGPGRNTLDEAESRHALRSLRLSAGDAVTLFDGRGLVAHGRLGEKAGISAKGLAAKRGSKAGVAVVVEQVVAVPPPARSLTLIVAACKGPRLDWLVEKCTELGVTRLVLAEFARSVVHIGPPHVEKLRRKAIEACKQCGRAWLPEIEAGVAFAAAIKDRASSPLLVAEPLPDARPLGQWLSQQSPMPAQLAAVVGPEGGISPEELETLRDSGAAFVRLGEHILRVETAAIAVAAAWATARNCT